MKQLTSKLDGLIRVLIPFAIALVLFFALDTGKLGNTLKDIKSYKAEYKTVEQSKLLIDSMNKEASSLKELINDFAELDSNVVLSINVLDVQGYLDKVLAGRSNTYVNEVQYGRIEEDEFVETDTTDYSSIKISLNSISSIELQTVINLFELSGFRYERFELSNNGDDLDLSFIIGLR